MTPLPKEFTEMLHDLLGDEASLLIEALDEPPVVSVRLNKRKPGAEFEDAQRVSWCESGLYLPERPEFIFDPLLHAGAYYVQDASSMVYETVAKILVSQFPEKFAASLRVLDMCAAPGGKTTAIINALKDGAEVTANEYTKKRVASLKENLEKWGYPYVKVTNSDSAYFASLGEIFDIVAVDTPCSGEGMMRKEEVARTQWSHNLVVQCATLQREILGNAVESLKPGGFLIYSTCTFNRKENEENAQFIADELGLQPFDLKLPEEWRIPRGVNTELPVYRFMPHKTRGEGLFLSVFRKRGEWEPSRQRKGIEGKGEKQGVETACRVEVSHDVAIKYLRGESIVLPEGTPKGIVTITFKGLPLGEAKNIGSRANNLYPKSWRIRKQ